MAIDRVRLLDENTANRIAAGEVVERPASAVKELVENALDAGATRISVHLEEGGKRRIVVSDNGCGMSRTDAVLALQRHATSKIRSADDLFAIATLGFRGEALPSIASVSRVVVSTCATEGEAGTRLIVDAGDIAAEQEIAAPAGTVIEVEDLFFNTPARLKFLKTTPTEVSRAVEAVGQLAAAHPGVAFQLLSGGQEIFSTPGTGDQLAALASLWGRDAARKLLPVRHGAGALSVSGFVATPDATRPGRSHELFFVNHRPIRSRLMSHALEEAFRSLTPESRYPIAALFVEIPPDMVDVNVHPTKSEVKFSREGEIHHAVSEAVKSGLLAYGIVPSARPEQPPQSGGWDGGQRAFEPANLAAVLGAFAPVGAHSGMQPLADFRAAVTGDAPPLSAAAAAQSEPVQGFDPAAPPRPFAERLREFQVLGQARNTYIIALTPDGIAVVDQHVAHERVLYERLTLKRLSNGIPVQRLAVPLHLSLSRREAVVLGEHAGAFTEAGWDIAPFGKESFVVRAIPAMLSSKPYEAILRDMVDELVNQSVARRLLVQQHHVTITNACKLAVKAGDPLTIEEMRGLLEQLAETENPYLCPHGRPIVVTVPFAELDRQFKRA